MAASWTIEQGSLPSGWTLTSAGQLQGRAGLDVSGTYPLIVRMTDGSVQVDGSCTVNLGKNFGLQGFYAPTGGTDYVTDRSGNFNNGSSYLGTPTWDATVPTNAGTVNGSSSSIKVDSGSFNLGNAPSLRLNTGTLMAHVRPTGTMSYPAGIIMKDGAWALCFNSGGYVSVYNYSNSQYISSSTTLQQDVWSQVAVVFDSGVTNGTTVHVHGSVVATGTLSVLNHNSSVLIGGNGGSPFYFPNMLMNDIRIYNRKLSSGEMIGMQHDLDDV